MNFGLFKKSDSRQGLALYFLFLTFFVVVFSMTINQALEISQVGQMQKKVFSSLAPCSSAMEHKVESEFICPLNDSEEK